MSTLPALDPAMTISCANLLFASTGILNFCPDPDGVDFDSAFVGVDEVEVEIEVGMDGFFFLGVIGELESSDMDDVYSRLTDILTTLCYSDNVGGRT